MYVSRQIISCHDLKTGSAASAGLAEGGRGQKDVLCPPQLDEHLPADPRLQGHPLQGGRRLARRPGDRRQEHAGQGGALSHHW